MSEKINALAPIVICSVAACVPAGVMAGGPGDVAGFAEVGKAAPGILKTEHPIPGQYNVVFKSTAVSAGGSTGTGQTGLSNADSLAATLASQYGVGINTVWKSALQGMSMTATAAQAEALAADSRVAVVEEDGEIQLDATQTGATWGLDRIDQRNLPLDTFYNYSTTASNVTAYVIDTGIRTTHSQFGGRASAGYDAFGGNSQDCHGHGTHVAGTVGGGGYGVAKGVKLKAVRVLNCSGSGSNSGVINGINWVTANKQLPAVANMSLGGSYSAALNQAVAGSIAAGITYVVAAGNSNANACSYSPASTPSAVTVGATTSSDSRASYSNYGTCLDIFAPGSSITSAWYSSDTATNTISGTSMASPHVAGAAALYLAANPTATPAQVATALINNATASKVVGPGTGSPNRLLYVGGAATPGDTILPTVSLSAPTPGQTLTGNAVTLAANAADNVAVAKVEFYAGTALLGTDTSAPYQVAWDSRTVGNGSYSFTAKATDTSGNVKTSTAVVVAVSNTGACTTTGQLVANSGFESGPASWTASRGAIWYIGAGYARGGSWAGWLDGYGSSHTDTLYQQVAIPATACAADLSFWLKVSTAESTSSVAYDKLTVTVQNTAGTVLGTLATYSNLNKGTGYAQKTFNLLPYKGQTVRLHFKGVEDGSLATSFFIDDVTLNIRK